MVMGAVERLNPPRVLGDMVLLAKLGEGGMASVYLAAVGKGSLARLAAVKLLRADLLDEDYRTRFIDEARVVVRLQHNNLVNVISAGEIDGQLYIAMEAIEGRDVADLWDRCANKGRAFPVPLAVYMVREVLRGLHYAHTFPGLSLVHRDVSPSNILVDWAGAVRVADFGLATSTLKDSLTMPGVVFGKVGYMSPEQAERQPLDRRADIYACGAVLWELLTGRPFRSPDGLDTEQVARFEAQPPSRYSKRVDTELDAIVMRAVMRSRQERWATAEAMMNALAGWLTSHAPDTGQERLAGFLTQLFGDTGLQERADRDAMLSSVRSHLDGTSTSQQTPERVPETTVADPRLPRPLPPGAENHLRPRPAKATPAGASAGDDGTAQHLERAPEHTVLQGSRRPAESTMARPQAGALSASEMLSGKADGERVAQAPRTPVRGDRDLSQPSPQKPIVGTAIGGAVPSAVNRADEELTPVATVEKIPENTILAERYRIISRLGRGGMGTVYLAEHTNVGRSVAVKVLTHEWSRSESVARRFRDEARSASAAGHPNIVEVFDAGELPDGRLFLVMEHLVGRNLYEEIRHRGQFDAQEACEIMRDVIRAIRAAHDVGVIHRDLKPDNVMLVDRGAGEARGVKVLDFGISASAERSEKQSRLTMPGHAVGTPEYMAPEQARGHSATESFDIYAIGVIFFELLAGEPPFSGSNFVDVMARKNTEPAPSLESKRPGLLRELYALVDACLQTDPTQRPASAAALLQRLESIMRTIPRGASGRASGEFDEHELAESAGLHGKRRAGVALAAIAAAAMIGVTVTQYDRWFNFEPDDRAAVAAAGAPIPKESSHRGVAHVAKAAQTNVATGSASEESVPRGRVAEAAPKPAVPASESPEDGVSTVSKSDGDEAVDDVEKAQDEARSRSTDAAKKRKSRSESRPPVDREKCDAIGKAIESAAKSANPGAILAKIREGNAARCFTGRQGRSERARWQVHAYKELKRWEDCEKAGDAYTSDKSIAQDVALCRARKSKTTD